VAVSYNVLPISDVLRSESEGECGESPCRYRLLGDRIFEKFIYTIPFFGGLFIIVFDFFVLKNGRGVGSEFHF